jgi:uncharacterized membrane protein YeiH
MTTSTPDTDVILSLNLAATFGFGISGGLAAVRARLDMFGVLVLAAVVALAGGITRDLLIGAPPETFRDNRYLIAAAAAGAACFFGRPTIERFPAAVLAFDALGLSMFCVTGADKAVALGVGSLQAVILGAITGIGGGILRDLLLREVPVVLRSELYAIPALAGAAVVVIGHELGGHRAVFALVGFSICLLVRLLGLRFNLRVPTAPSERTTNEPDT